MYIVNIKVNKWGNSYGIRLPKWVIEELGLASGSELDFSYKSGRIVLSKSSPSLDQLVAKISPKNRHPELDMGSLSGKELW